MRNVIALLFACLFIAPAVQARVIGQEVSYVDQGVTMKGYLAYDKDIKGKRPGILVVHEWWGHNDYARRRAMMLAGLGYTALAVDMYGDGKQADHPDDAGKFAAQVSKNLPVARARLDAALNLLRKHATVQADQIAGVGYCFGGGLLLNLARQGIDLRGIASFHGTLATDSPAQPGKIKAKLAIFTGADDPMVPQAQVDGFVQEMRKAGVEHSVTNYPGAKHAFTNPAADDYARRFNLPVAYNAEADKDSWAKLGTFLIGLFGERE